MPRGKRNRQLKQGLISAGRSGIANPIDIHVGMRIRLRRKVLKISQEELAEKLGLTFQQVQKYERGMNRISASRLYDVAQVLQTPISFFFEDMSDDVTTNAPRIRAGLSENLPTASNEADPMIRRETLELVRNYYMIKDPKMRKLVFDLVKNMTKPNIDPEKLPKPKKQKGEEQ